ncbi:hypothetical protein ACQPYE_05820 [Actinosynnema sp. CA-299493]
MRGIAPESPPPRRALHQSGGRLPMPLSPSALETTSAIRLVSPDQAGNALLPGEESADLIQWLERKSA